MANKLKPKLLAICQDDWGKRGHLPTTSPTSWKEVAPPPSEGLATLASQRRLSFCPKMHCA
jgi:hypothetical protein